MNKNEIERSIKTYEAILGDLDKLDAENHQIGIIWENLAGEGIKKALVADFVETAGLNISVRPAWRSEKDSKPEISLRWKVGTSDFTVDFYGPELISTRISGMSGKGGDLDEIADYYNVVGQVLGQIKGNPLENFKKFVAAVTRPEYKRWEGMTRGDVNDHIRELNNKLKINNMDLHIGGKVNIWIEGKHRWVRDRWVEGEVVSVTAKNYKINAEGWNYLVKFEDVAIRCKPLNAE